MKSKLRGAAQVRAATESTDGPALPVWKAFVVQFSRETGTQPEAFAGRVEHMSSGHRVRFASKQELITELEKMLGELGEEGS